MSIKKITKKAKLDWMHNVEQRLFDKDGKPKKLFAENLLGRAILYLVRMMVPHPIDDRGQVKPGLMNYVSTFGVRIPFVTGRWQFSRLVANGITNTGKAALASRFNGSGGEAAFTAIGIGTDATAFAATQTALLAGKKADATADSGVHALATASVTASRVTTTVTNDTAQLTGTIAVTGTMTITESGVFNADTNGVMACRQTFSGVAVASGDSFVPTWKVSNA